MKIKLNRKRFLTYGLWLIFFVAGIFLVLENNGAISQDKPGQVGNSNFRNLPAILDAGSCINSMETTRIILTSSDATKTEFSIPISYLSMGFNVNGGEQDVIGLAAILKNMKPACGSPEYASNDNEIWNREVINLDLRPETPEGFYKSYNRYKDNEYTNFVFNDDFGFPVYRRKQDVEKNKGFKELLIPPADLFNRPSYIFCARPGLQSGDGSRARCEIVQQYRPHIRLSYNISHYELDNLKEIDQKIDQLLSAFLTKRADK